MNSLERVRRACLRQTSDYVPVCPFTGFNAARTANVSLRKYITDGRTIADAQIQLQRQTGQDAVVTAADTYYLAEGFGLEAVYYDDRLPTADKPLLNELSDAATLKVPNPLTDGRMPVYLDAVKYLSRELGDSVAIRGTGTGPFSVAAYLYGTQRFLLKLAEIDCGAAITDDEKNMRLLLDIATEASAAFLEAQLKAGAHLIYLGDSLASCDMVSPDMYRKYAKPYHKEIFSRLNCQCANRQAFTLLHICGDNTAIIDDLADTGVHILEIDQKMDIAECKRRIGEKVCLIGNLDPANTILNGSTKDVYKQSQKCIELAAAGGGFILGTGCFVPYESPIENLKAMVEAARNYPN